MSSELTGAAMLQQRRRCENEAACLLAAVLVDGYSQDIGYYSNTINHRR